MKLIIDGYNKTLRKKDNQIVVMEKDNEIYRISANKVSDITIMTKGHITFDALNLMAKNNINLISINYSVKSTIFWSLQIRTILF